MDLTLDVKFDDGRELKVKAGPRDQLAWERQVSGRAFGTMLMSAVKVGDLYSLAHAAMSRQGLYSGTLKDLEASADVIIGMTDEATPDAEVTDDDRPTLAGRSTDG